MPVGPRLERQGKGMDGMASRKCKPDPAVRGKSWPRETPLPCHTRLSDLHRLPWVPVPYTKTQSNELKQALPSRDDDSDDAGASRPRLFSDDSDSPGQWVQWQQSLGVIKLLLWLVHAVSVEVHYQSRSRLGWSTLHSADIYSGSANSSPAATLPLPPSIQQPEYSLPRQAIETIETASRVTLGSLRASSNLGTILGPWLSSLNQWWMKKNMPPKDDQIPRYLTDG
ncbi:hypothetical protein BDP55DRAFT_711238 [Colletotrichum godetiae]|uniref:Uncharacterized protein n=1 Tax=Colletotrichum godetiae TaxID=1209918 RepID=A0AAJ0AWN6_9PEZI|nr:uncharacterized protein BDP55DRAFT_711238 [Colletotrichum godetiae]KAK1691680.1 hypothetical protein BDP55DRAFT_711238 [Colletotrichum godetiae]